MTNLLDFENAKKEKSEKDLKNRFEKAMGWDEKKKKSSKKSKRKKKKK